MSNNITRRALIAAIPAAPIAMTATPGVTKPVHDFAQVWHDPIPGWYAQWRDERDAWNNSDPDSSHERMLLLEQRIYGEWPRSIEGVIAKLSWMIESCNDNGEWDYPGHLEAVQTAIAGLTNRLDEGSA